MLSPTTDRCSLPTVTGVTPETPDLLAACEDFEALFLAQLMSQMRETLPEGGILPRSIAERIFQAQLDVEMCRSMSRRGSLGLAALLYQTLSQQPRRNSPMGPTDDVPLHK